jgi:hypothetical protein
MSLQDGWLADPGVALVLLSILLGVVSLVPRTVEGLDSDGRKLIKLFCRPDDREVLVEQLLLTARIDHFLVLFRSGQKIAASEQLDRMEKACQTPNGSTMQLIADHWRNHITSGESIDACTWSPNSLQRVPKFAPASPQIRSSEL